MNVCFVVVALLLPADAASEEPAEARPRSCSHHTPAPTPLTLLCPSWHRSYAGASSGGRVRNNRGVGGIWRWSHNASCREKGGSYAKFGDKESELVLDWAGVQENLDWDAGDGGRGNVGTRLTKAFM